MLDSKAINKLCIIAGSGELPLAIINKCIKENINFVVAAIKNQTNKSSIKDYEHFWITLSSSGKLINTMKDKQVSHICFVGAVKRPSLFSLFFHLDSLGKELFKKYFKQLNTLSGDNSLLSFIIKLLEKDYGFKVIAAQNIEPEILSHSNKNYSTTIIPNEYMQDICLGFKIAKNVGALDIGQSLIIQQKVIIAVEGVEGTKNLIKRSKKLLYKKGRLGVLIKVKKPNQEDRIDLPTIGLETMKSIKKIGLKGVVIEGGSTIILQKDEVIKFANKHKLFILSVTEKQIKEFINSEQN